MEGSIVMAKEARLSVGYNDGHFLQVLTEPGLLLIEGNMPSLTKETALRRKEMKIFEWHFQIYSSK
jgi:hypothetical protein